MNRKRSAEKKHTSVIASRYVTLSFLILLFAVFALVSSSSKPTSICANSISCSDSLRLKIENNTYGSYNNRAVLPPVISLDREEAQKNVLGESDSKNEKHIFVDLAKQKVYAYDGTSLYMEASISSGKWGRTPTGDFTVWTKIRATRMSGGSGADYYNLPNVPYVMFFSNQEVPANAGFSFHGAYWHNNFGHPMSHGCINMKERDAKKLYEWADNKIAVTIFGEAPV